MITERERAEYDELQRKEAREKAYDKAARACPWARLCDCPHTDCSGGWADGLIETPDHPGYQHALMCPACEAAREAICLEKGWKYTPRAVKGLRHARPVSQQGTIPVANDHGWHR
jgi:hypothetical protein